AVRDGTNYAYYTVVVTKADPLSWSTSATFPLGVSEIKAAIDTLTGYPVAAISGTDGYLYYLTYDGTALSAEKITMDGSAVKGTDVGLAFSRTALPYISYLDEDSDLCVIYKTTGWQYAGRKIDRDCEHTGSALGFTPDNKLAVFASDSVSICDVTTWQKPHGVGNPYFSLHGVYPNIVKAGSGLDVVYRSSESNGGISICRYTGFEWSVLADDFCQPNSAGGNSTMQVGTFGIDTDPSGDILMAVNNDCEGTGLRQRVLVYDNVTGSITQLGGYVDEGFDGNSISDIAVSYSNDIYHLYTIRNAVGELYPYVSEYDKADGVWSDGLSMNSQPIVAADMVVNDDGQLYVFTVGRDHNVVLSALE
ncbi:MAG: hypothetical protein LKJ93_06325, partial [Bacteroidales bacterium]|nr:hypothetical protein [Bacteroidales bacterium]